MNKKNKMTIIVCIFLLIILIGVQWIFAIPYVLRDGINTEVQIEHLLISFVLTFGFAAIYYNLFRNIDKKHKIIRGLLIYFMTCGCLGMVCCLLMMLLL